LALRFASAGHIVVLSQVRLLGRSRSRVIRF
jgi:hypothetical protein